MADTGNETGKVYEYVKNYLEGRGLDAGCGAYPLKHPNLDTLDLNPVFNPTYCCSADNLKNIESNTYDFVFSSHCLEHIWFPSKALKEWIRVLKPSGYLLLFLPHKYFYSNVRDEEGNADHKHDFTLEDIVIILDRIGRTHLIKAGILAEKTTSRWKGKIAEPKEKYPNQYSFYIVAQKKKTQFKNHRIIEDWLNRIHIIKHAVLAKLVSLISSRV